MKARRSPKPWRPIPTLSRNALYLDLIQARGANAFDLRKHREEPKQQPPQLQSNGPIDPPDPLPVRLNPYDGSYGPPDGVSHSKWLQCPDRHVHGLATPLSDHRGKPGGRIISMAYDVFGSGLIGSSTSLHMASLKLWDGPEPGPCWDNAVRLLEEAG